MKHYKMPGQCPICGDILSVNKLKCNKCHTILEGDFMNCKFCRLPSDQLTFLEVFVKCRGNIKDVEKELSISYPTVRSKLDSLIESLGYTVEHSQEDRFIEEQKESILNALAKGEISAKEAANQLRKLK
ncbi:MAG: DUF2089 domain-containing protein [Eubacteriales bacterium]